jgi:SAM-dependent methyltransferase
MNSENSRSIRKSEWADFFNGYAPVYEENEFTHNTLEEVDFLMNELGLTPGQEVLDVGCGTGRHAIELARRGMVVTGLDVSAGMLAKARAQATSAGLQINWIQADAREFSFEQPFDNAICLCEGAFGLLGSLDDAIDQPLAILRNVSAALKPGAKCLFTVLNGYALARNYNQKDVEQGRFDPLSLTERSGCKPAGYEGETPLRERGFVPTELVLLFGMAGLNVIHIWGGTAGGWNRQTIGLDEIEIMVVAQKR